MLFVPNHYFSVSCVRPTHFFPLISSNGRQPSRRPTVIWIWFNAVEAKSFIGSFPNLYYKMKLHSQLSPVPVPLSSEDASRPVLSSLLDPDQVFLSHNIHIRPHAQHVPHICTACSSSLPLHSIYALTQGCQFHVIHRHHRIYIRDSVFHILSGLPSKL